MLHQYVKPKNHHMFFTGQNKKKIQFPHSLNMLTTKLQKKRWCKDFFHVSVREICL